jgi:hypothetical protein
VFKYIDNLSLSLLKFVNVLHGRPKLLVLRDHTDKAGLRISLLKAQMTKVEKYL